MTRFAPAGPLRGQVTPPRDKSISHRAALFGAMCDEPVTIRGFLQADDTLATLDAVRSLGAGVDTAGDDVLVRGVGLRTAQGTTGGLIDVRNAGTLMRILPGWLAGQPGGQWTLDGDESIRRRPVDRIAEPLRRMGAEVETAAGGLPPLTLRGAALTGTHHELHVASAQVKSCLLIAGLLAEGDTTVTEPAPSRDHTERILRRGRVPLEREGSLLRVCAVDELELDDVKVPGDPSSAAFLVAAALVIPGSRILVSGVGLNWTRAGFFRIARRMGAIVLGDLEPPPAEREASGKQGDPGVGSDPPDAEPVGELDVAAAALEATTVGPEEVALAIDELPLVALLGCFAEGETVVRGAEELRRKESDRIAAVVEGLRGIGADVEATDDGFVARPGGIEGGSFDARGDHRMAMLGAVAGLASRRGVEVVGIEAAGVSYPGFEGDLASLLESA